jgi:hypothetical protein
MLVQMERVELGILDLLAAFQPVAGAAARADHLALVDDIEEDPWVR